MDIPLFQYVPLPWYHNSAPFSYELRSGVHTMLDIRSPVQTPPPPYTEKPDLPARNPYRKQPYLGLPIYTPVRPSLSRIKTTYPPKPPSPTTSSFSYSSEESRSPTSDTGSLSSGSSMFSSRSLRRSKRRPRGMSLREIRLKESEADLSKVYRSTVDTYLNGEIFDNFKSWPEPVILEEPEFAREHRTTGGGGDEYGLRMGLGYTLRAI